MIRKSHPKLGEFVGKYFLFREWPRKCTFVFGNGVLEFGVGNWDREITVEEPPASLSDAELYDFMRNVCEVNSAMTFMMWLLNQDEYMQKVWRERTRAMA